MRDPEVGLVMFSSEADWEHLHENLQRQRSHPEVLKAWMAGELSFEESQQALQKGGLGDHEADH